MSFESSGPQSDSPEVQTVLPVLGQPVPERADAARNRARILTAAAELFACRGVGNVSMDQIATTAGVGKGTLFRRFGDKAGLAAALLGAQEERLQHAILRGRPPVGPGAEPGERLVAFLAAYSAFLDENLDLVHLSETAGVGARYRVGAYRFWHHHVALLLRAARPDLADLAPGLAAALLAPLAAELRRAQQADPARLGPDPAAMVVALARLVLSGSVAGVDAGPAAVSGVPRDASTSGERDGPPVRRRRDPGRPAPD
jgi:AcrR family transcriptional regulator